MGSTRVHTLNLIAPLNKCATIGNAANWYLQELDALKRVCYEVRLSLKPGFDRNTARSCPKGVYGVDYLNIE